VALLPFFQRLCRVKLFSAGFNEAEAAVDGREFRPEAEDADIDGLAAVRAESIFGCGEQVATEPSALMAGVYGEHAEIAAVPAEFGVDGA